MNADVSKAVFLSYASQDAEAAKRICEALRQAGVEVWFDQSELRGGDAWDAKIRKQIKECALFVPIISANTQARAEGYFRLEWKLAVDRSYLMADDAPFLFPIVIDDTPDATARVPDKFRDVQWTRLNVKDTPETLATRVARLLSGAQPAEAGDRRPEAGSAHRRSKHDRSRWIMSALAGAVALAAAIGAWFALRPSSPPATGLPSPASPAAPAAVSEARQLAARARAMSLDKYDSSIDDFTAAEGLIKRALELDSNDGEIWAISSLINFAINSRGFERTPARNAAARAHAERALKLAPDSVEALFALARWQRDSEEPAIAEAGFLKILARNPDHVGALHNLGYLYDRMDRIDEAAALYAREARNPAAAALAGFTEYLMYFRRARFAEAEQAVRKSIAVEPSSNAQSGLALLLLTWRGDAEAAASAVATGPATIHREHRPIWVTAFAHLCRRQPADTLRVLERLPDEYILDNMYTGPKAYWVGLAHAQAGREAAARVAWEAGLALVDQRLRNTPADYQLRLARGELLAWLGREAEALQEVRTLEQLAFREQSWIFTPARIYAALGRTDEALRLIEQQLQFTREHRNLGWPLTPALLRIDPRWDKIRDDPRFQKLCAESVKQNTEYGGQMTASSSLSLSLSPPPDAKSVAVLAFANLSDDKANEYFSDGISEELLNVLAKVPGLKVTARTSSFHFKGKDTPIPEIAQQLGVAYVVEGSVRKAGDKVRITAQLIKAADGFHVWSDTFTRDLKDIFAVQDEIAGLIAKNLELKMGMVAARPMIDVEAYQEFLAGRAAAAKAGNADLREAVAHFERAVALEPKFTAAWVQLASAHTQLGRWGGAPTRQSWAAARAAIDHAVALEPDSPDVLLALGWILRTAEWNWRGAEQAFRRSLQLRPDHPDALAGAAVLLFNIGQTEEAFRLGQQAARLDPLNAATQIDLSIMFYLNHNWIEAELSARRALQLAPGGGSYHSILGWSLTAQRRYDEAEAEIALDNNESEQAQAFGSLAIARGQDAVARKWLARLEEIAQTHGDNSDVQMNIAWLSVGLGDKERAFAALEKARATRDPSLSWLRNSWYLNHLHSDPRWPAFLRKVGLADDQLK